MKDTIDAKAEIIKMIKERVQFLNSVCGHMDREVRKMCITETRGMLMCMDAICTEDKKHAIFKRDTGDFEFGFIDENGTWNIIR